MIYKTYDTWSQIFLYLHNLNNSNNQFKSLIFIDVDNTLITPTTNLGSDHFFDWQIDLIEKKDPQSLTNNKQNMLKILFDIWKYIDYRLCDNEINQILESLVENKQSDLLLCTARSIENDEITVKTLEKFNLTKYLSSNLIDDCTIEKDHLRFTIKNGIIYCNGQNKGQIIELITQNILQSFNNIILIDDKISNLEKFINHINYSKVIAIHYTGMENIINHFRQGPKKIVLSEYDQFIKSKNNSIL